MRGNRDYLLQLLFILIENGFKYTPSGQVRLSAVQSESHVGLTVSDTGIGLTPEEVPHIFQRFYRADVSRGQTSGTGLGLSIAKWIADMHDSRLEVRSKLGEGSAFTVWLPITAVQYSD
ncbi:sensor histidine kinase [Cohnella kolymensis]|uniref:sensor histidine kinase n=1 Tax=Cohnella kolymensis TaxID=1590652 RepID=UPI000695FE4D|nr:ATP-binding protein [Cohnella kolymensis]